MPEHFLIVDDDPTFTRVLARAMTRRGFEVAVARNVPDAISQAREQLPTYATVDLKMDGPSGLALIPELRALNPEMKILVLTGYASIATTVDAIKSGADNYLPKPADADQILRALAFDTDTVALPAEIPDTPMSVNRLEWEHIQKVPQEHDGNISATARALGMHRRTLQRKLAKHPVRR
ncbi:response regulator transcription factor [Marinobacterium sediminicola]|uniref:Two-component system, response regulator RegA n=1 Tax=Marinobacterium sediminicola TaxID=518898 RepID=A0ABY1S084_9GAMM|nr:response regulator transcription factor [Marinobacterium sediminicola]ULG69665.1 response regulator transcription factor [Marinobacterium sediminicola]SMR74607.1 two-component system, response regulator RegA [Marinobacterium sediminicola]